MSASVGYDTKNARNILRLLSESPRGLTIAGISKRLKLNRHTVSNILERLLIEKKVDYDQIGPSKVFYSLGIGKFIKRIDQERGEKLWIDVFKPKYPDKEPFVRINQTRYDYMSKSENKYRSIGAVAIKLSKLPELIETLKSILENDKVWKKKR